MTMKEISFPQGENNTANFEFKLLAQAQVELFLHQIGKNRSYRLAKLMMNQGLRQLSLQLPTLQKGKYIYVLKANEQPMDMGRVVIQ
jgi:hypothetical protein